MNTEGQLRARAFEPNRLRRTVLEMAYRGSAVHIACAFSIIEVLAVLYRKYLRLGKEGPRSPDRDYFALSKGHGVMAQYACLHELCWLSERDIHNYFADGTALKGLSDAHVPGLEVTSGSLGHGLSVAVGLALATKRKGTGQKVFALVGDGECNEGPIWEALLFARQQRLSNLTVIVDANGHQAMGRTRDVVDMGSLAAKLQAFGCETREVNGHDESQLDRVFAELAECPADTPRALVAHTVKGYGVSFMADDNRWHYTRLTRETYERALAELN